MLLAYARYASECYDAPVSAPDARVVLAWFVAVVVAWVVLPRVPWVRVYRALDAVEVPAPRVLVAGWGLVCRAFRRVRAVLDPAGERWREMGRYLASLPPRSGLTPYEEMLEEVAALPPGRDRAALRVKIVAYCRRPSPDAVASARFNAGRPAVEPRVVAYLLAGKEPPAWRYRRELAEARARRLSVR